MGLTAAEQQQICVVIPALNEARSIAAVVASVKSALPDSVVLVVDDGSSDDTAKEAERSGAIVLSNPFNLGIGGAVQAGYKYAFRHGSTVAVQIDGDGQHDPNEVHLIVSPILQGLADMTIGSRWLGRGDYLSSRSRRLGMHVLSAIVHWRIHQSFTDTTSGFRAVNRELMEVFTRIYPSDYPEVESLVFAVERGFRVEEIGVRMVPRAHGTSTLSGLSSPYYMVRVAIALLVGRLGIKR